MCLGTSVVRHRFVNVITDALHFQLQRTRPESLPQQQNPSRLLRADSFRSTGSEHSSNDPSDRKRGVV